eukprot:6181250-Pleurochrysis_carterae.AAC.2
MRSHARTAAIVHRTPRRAAHAHARVAPVARARWSQMTRSVHGFQVLLATLRKSMVPLAMLVVFISLLSCLFSALATSVGAAREIDGIAAPLSL